MSEDDKRVVIVGGGFCGLSAAYDLVRAGYEVTIFEAEPDLGGLAGTFELQNGIRIEKFYHHWFTSDTHILDLAKDLGLESNLEYISSKTGLYYANSIFRLSSPLELLAFHPIPFLDRIRTGLMALYARRISDWRSLEDQTAEEWLIKVGGRRAFDVIWKPLLKGKFGEEASNVSAVWFWNKLKLRGSSRNDKGKEQLVYIRGSFGSLVDALRAELSRLGVEIVTGTPVEKIEIADGRVTGLRVGGARLSASTVLVTTPLPDFLSMTSGLPDAFQQQCREIRFLGNVCLVLRLKRSLSDTYWLNVADPSFPFVGVIEHTNFDSKEFYGGEHIAYLSKYLSTKEWLYSASPEETLKYCIPYIQKIFPEFSEDWLHGFSVWKAPYSQPVITKRYSQLIPEYKTPVDGLWLATMAQVYPEDRGTNYAVRDGRKVAKLMINSL